MQLTPDNPWSSLEVVKLIVGVLTPLSVATFGFFISRRLKRLELAQWSNQKLIEKRLAIYDSIAPLLNQLLCFYTWVGNWKEVSPEDVTRSKRELDKAFNIYRHVYDEDVYRAYQVFIHTLFETFKGAGVDAKIRSCVQGEDGDRTAHSTYTWNPQWSLRFANSDIPTKAEIRTRYIQLMHALSTSFGAER